MITLISLNSLAEESLCYGHNRYFLMEVPDGWATDTVAAKMAGSCLYLYPSVHNQKSTPAFIKVRLAKLNKPGLEKQIEKDMKAEQLAGKLIRIDSEPDLINSFGQNFILKKIFENSLTPFEARAYLKSDIGLVITVVTKKNAEIPLYEGIFKTFLNSIRSIAAENVFETLKLAAEQDKKNPTAKDFDVRYTHSIGPALSRALKSCRSSKSEASLAVIRVDESGKIIDWFDEKTTALNSCVSKKMTGVRGTKTPFAPFRIILDLDYHLKNFSGQSDSRRR